MHYYNKALETGGHIHMMLVHTDEATPPIIIITAPRSPMRSIGQLVPADSRMRDMHVLIVVKHSLCRFIMYKAYKTVRVHIETSTLACSVHTVPGNT